MKKDKVIRRPRLFRTNFAYAEKGSYMGTMGPGEGTLMIGNPRTHGAVLSVKF
jgi:hypothetical protein